MSFNINYGSVLSKTKENVTNKKLFQNIFTFFENIVFQLRK